MPIFSWIVTYKSAYKTTPDPILPVLARPISREPFSGASIQILKPCGKIEHRRIEPTDPVESFMNTQRHPQAENKAPYQSDSAFIDVVGGISISVNGAEQRCQRNRQMTRNTDYIGSNVFVPLQEGVEKNRSENVDQNKAKRGHEERSPELAPVGTKQRERKSSPMHFYLPVCSMRRHINTSDSVITSPQATSVLLPDSVD